MVSAFRAWPAGGSFWTFCALSASFWLPLKHAVWRQPWDLLKNPNVSSGMDKLASTARRVPLEGVEHEGCECETGYTTLEPHPGDHTQFARFLWLAGTGTAKRAKVGEKQAAKLWIRRP